MKRKGSTKKTLNKNPKKSKKTTVIFENCPEINNLYDLIELGKKIKFYKNIDNITLWKITPYLEKLNNMVGMISLKETIFFQIIYYLKGFHLGDKNDEYLHTVIMGPPGTGKTTVAKIIGNIYKELGVLSSSGNVTLAYRDDFIAEYLGQTAIKTRKLLESCLGGVLIIDEVYSLAAGKDKDSFAREALDTLTAFLSENKNNFCCIILGYEKDIYKTFFGTNDGLERRFPWKHKIDKYKPQELALIFYNFIKNSRWKAIFTTNELEKIIKENETFFEYAGGSIETFIGKIKMIHAKRVFNLDKESMYSISYKDLKNTIDYMKKYNKGDELNTNSIIKSMYI